MNLVNENATRLKSPAFVRLRYSTARIVGIAGTTGRVHVLATARAVVTTPCACPRHPIS